MPQVAFEPEWTKRRKAAPFRRRDAMPIRVVLFPGGGIRDNLADEAWTKGIPVQKGVKAGA